MNKLLTTLLTITMVLCTACSKAPKQAQESKDTSKVIIKVNEQNITENDFKKLMDKQMKSSFLGDKKLDMKDPKNKFVFLLFKDRAVNELLIRELLEQEVKRMNIHISNGDVDKALDGLAKKVGGQENLEKTLKMNNVSVDDLKVNIKEDLKIKKLIDNLAITKVSDKEVEKFYDKNKNTKFTYPDKVRAKHILISASKDDIKAKIEDEEPNLSDEEINKQVDEEMARLKKKAQDVLVKAKAKPSEFDILAMKYSEDFSSAKEGGDLGFFTKGQMVPEFSKAAFSMKPDTISEIVQTNFGYHIIKVTDRKSAGITPFKEVELEIKQYLEDQNKVKVLQEFLDNLKQKATIEYVDNEYNPTAIQKELKEFAKEKKELKK